MQPGENILQQGYLELVAINIRIGNFIEATNREAKSKETFLKKKTFYFNQMLQRLYNKLQVTTKPLK